MLKTIPTTVVLYFALISTLSSQKSKMVLIEEGTGTWCAWCPEGKVLSKELLRKYHEELIFIEVHSHDPMTNEAYKDSTKFSFYPSGHINRKIKQVEPRQWETAIVNELNQEPPAKINVDLNFDILSRKVIVNISADFFESLSGEYRFAAIVMEDAITGDNEDYNQDNVFANNAHGPMGGYEILPSSVPYDIMVYDHIGRHLLGGYNGVNESLPNQLIAGNTYTHQFEWTLPSEYNQEYIWVAALLIDNENGKVINAGKSNYLLGHENAKPFFVSAPLSEAHSGFKYTYNIRYHDPSYNSCNIEIIEPIPSWLNFQKGRTGFALLEGTPENLGTYDITLRLTDSEYAIDQSFQIVVKDSITPPTISTVKDDFFILPNPNDGVFTLEYDKGVKYQIFDNLGRMVLNGTLARNLNYNNLSQPINLGELNNGIYFLKVFDNNDFVKTKKLIISRN